MKKSLFPVLITLLILSVLSSCSFQSNGLKPYTYTDDEMAVFLEKDIKKLYDGSQYTKSDSTISIFCIVVDSQGNEKNIDIKAGMKRRQKIVKNNDTSEIVIYSIDKSPLRILPVRGNGMWDKIWGMVLYNTKTGIIENVFFAHKSETAGLGANFIEDEFCCYFIGKNLTFSGNDFAYWKADTLVSEGTHRVDAISGASITCHCAVDMVNESLCKYKAYFNK